VATISLSTNDRVYYKNGKSGASAVVGYESSSRRVCRIKFTAPSTGATGVNITWYTAGRGNGSHIPIKFYIGTDPGSHANAGYDYAATGTLAVGEDWMTFTGSANILLLPNQTYYLWIFPGEDTFGWYTAYRTNYTSTLVTSGAAMSGISGPAGTLGAVHKLTLKRYSSSLTHTITAACGKAFLTIASGVQADTVSWTPPVGWAAQNTTGLQVTVEIKCTTYDGSTAIGSTSVSLVFAIPESVVPTVSAVVTDKNGHFAKYGSYIKSKSQAEVTVSGEGAYGSQITAYSISNGSDVVSGPSMVFDLPKTGTITFTVSATDSRGRKTSATVSVEVVDYSAPTVTILAAYRSDENGNQDDDGIHAAVVFKADITPLGSRNSAEYTLLYRKKGSSDWTSVQIPSLSGDYTPDGAVQIVPVELDFAYEFSVKAADNFGTVDSIYRTVQVAFFLLSFHRETKAVGIGQKATEPGTAAFGLPAKFNAGVIADGKTMAFVYSESVGGYVLMEVENANV